MQESTEPIEESDEAPSTSTTKKQTANPWKHQSEETYRKTAEKLVHFSSKTVNSNASAAGIRLTAGDGLDLPYVSARTLINAGVELELDYAEGGAAQAGIIKQLMACQTNDPFADAATAEEKACIRPLLEKIRDERFELGTGKVDLRLRQLLIPKENAPGGYVAVTPITSGSVCHILFNNEDGLVLEHNRKASDAAKTKKTSPFSFIRQARMGIGGANPQNVGRLTRNMQQPILVSAPPQDARLRHALSIYHKGLTFDFSRYGPYWDALIGYSIYRDELTDKEKNTMQTNMKNRAGETTHFHGLGALVEAQAQQAFSLLWKLRENLPQEHLFETGIEPEYELVSRKVHGVIRGLIDPRLRKTDYKKDRTGREMNWPREMAEYIADAIVNVRHVKDGESILLFPLDDVAKMDLTNQLEDYFR